MKKLFGILILLIITVVGFGQSLNVEPYGRTIIDYKRIGNTIYLNYRKFTDNTGFTQYPENYSGTIYYVSSSTGNDSNAGTKSAPFASIDKVNTLTLSGDDAVLFYSEDSIIGQITVNNSGNFGHPITFGTYGPISSKPKIYGSEEITGWTLHSGNIYKKVLTNDITQLFVDGERATAARYPKTLYYDITTVNSTTQFTSTEITSQSTDYYKDATIILRDDPWSIASKTVTGSTGQTITINSAPAGTLKVNWGFYMVGKLEFLTAAGEWYYDTATKTVYFWTPNGDTPDNYEVRGSVNDYGVFLDNGKDYVTIKDLDIREQSLYGILIRESDNVTVDNCNIENVASQGVRIDELAGYATVQNCTISNIQTYGIRSYGEFNTFDNNVISNIGLVENINQSGYFYGDAIYHSEGGNCTISNNRIDSIGYIGIHFDENAQYTLVENNTVSNGMLSLTDGGGIYCWVRPDLSKPVTGSIIRNNYIENMVGNLDGAVATSKAANGIYLDDRVSSVNVYGNTVNGVAEYGLFLHNNIDANVYDNTFYNSGRSYYITHDFSAANNIVHNNTFYNIPESPSVNSIAARLGTVTSASAYTVADVDSNIYVDRTRSVPFRGAVSPYNESFADWKTETGWDAASTYYSTALGAGETQRLIVNTGSISKTYYINNATAREIDGTSITTSFTLASFESKIVEGSNLDCILDYSDAVAPVITAFVLPETSETLTVTPTTVTATGEATVFIITGTNTEPELTDNGWSESPSYLSQSDGETTLYLWARDAAGNISASASDIVDITGTPATIGTNTILSLTSGTANAVRAYPVTMTENGLINQIVIYHSAGNGTEQIIGGIYADDGANHPSTLLATTASTVISTSAEWQTINFTTPVYVESGTKIWIGWNKNGASTLAYEAGSVTRASKNATFGALPDPYGTADTYQNYGYSVYVNYLK